MDRQIAFILAGATLALGFGGYLMTASMGEYDMDKSAKNDAARVERLEAKADDKKGPGLFAALLQKASVKMETARNVYLGEHFPKTPDGWQLHKTHHDEMVDFTVDYKLSLDITDKSSMRRLTGWGGQSLARTTDLAYRKGDKVIFMRLTFANKKLKKPLNNVHSWLFNGSFSTGPNITLAGATFETRQYKGTDLINIASETGYYTGIGIFTNASMAEVETLLNGMDMFAFASLTGNPEGGAIVPFLKTGDGGLQAMSTIDADVVGSAKDDMVKAAPKASPKGNLLDGLNASDDEEDVVEQTEEKPKRKRKNLLSSLLGGGDDEEEVIEIKTKQKKAEKSGSSFQKVGNFTSRCQSGGGAKICRVDE